MKQLIIRKHEWLGGTDIVAIHKCIDNVEWATYNKWKNGFYKCNWCGFKFSSFLLDLPYLGENLWSKKPFFGHSYIPPKSKEDIII